VNRFFWNAAGELWQISIPVPGGRIDITSDSSICPYTAGMLAGQIQLTHKVPRLPDGVKVRFKKAVA
jgi:hypothetical protein